MSEAVRKFWRGLIEEWRDDVATALVLLLAYALGEAGASLWWVLVPSLILGAIVRSRVDRARKSGIAAGVAHVFSVVDRRRAGASPSRRERSQCPRPKSPTRRTPHDDRG